MDKVDLNKKVTLVVRLFNGTSYIQKERLIADCILDDVPRSVIAAMEKEFNATAVSWWLG